jgi:hypothetical protein
MAGYITNPFSSDFNPTTSIAFSSESIPIAAYGLIGLTSLTLAYVTLVASSQGDSKQSSIASATASATSMLPAIFSPKTPPSPSMIVSPFGTKSPSPVPASAQVVNTPIAEAVPIKSEKPAFGGKTRNKKHKNKKTKRSRK